MSNSRFGLRTRAGLVRGIVEGIPSFNLILDDLTNAAAAYSLRRLRNGYTGAAIRVRRSSDNAEQDIGFDGNNNLDTASLLAFVGAGNGNVTTWYDQSLNNRNVTQGVLISQPRIVLSGVLENENAKPAVFFDGSDDFLLGNATFNNGSFFIYGVVKAISSNAAFFDHGNNIIFASANGIRFDRFSNNFRFGSNKSFTQFSDSTSVQKLYSAYTNPPTDRKIFINSVNVATTNGNNPADYTGVTQICIGASLTTFANKINGTIQEIIAYDNDKLSFHTSIESYINTYYNIYP